MSEIEGEELPDLGYTARAKDSTIDTPGVSVSCAKPCDPAHTVGKSTNIGNSDKKLSYIIKIVPALNFKCGHCLKKYTTDDGMKKHLNKDHGIVDEFPVNDYTTFMGTRRKKVVVNSKPMSPNEVSAPPIGINKIESLETEEPFRCSMCDKVFKSCEGVRKHLKTFHNVTHNVHNLYKRELHKAVAAKRSQPVFTPPLIAATSHIQVSGPPSKSGQTQNQCRTKTNTMPDFPPTTKVSEEPPAKNKPKNPKPKPKFKFCNSISNPFSRGDVNFEKISIWDRSQSNSKHSKSPLNSKPTQQQVTTQKPMSTNTLVPPVPNESPEPAKLPVSTQPLVLAQPPMSTDPLVPAQPPRSTDPLVPTQPPMSTEPLVPTQPQMSTDPLVPTQQPMSTDLLVPNQPPMSTDPLVPTQPPISTEPKVPTQPPVSKRIRKCQDPRCKACSILANCGECNNCINKALKQRCKKRQCKNLNSRVRRATKSPNKISEEVIDEIGDPERIVLNEVLNDETAGDIIKEIVDDIINNAYHNVAKKSIPKKQQSEMKKPKLYECSECKEKFAHFASADKHCKRNSKGAVCPICGVKISHSKNLNRHIKKTHQNPITKQMKVPQEVPKCDDCGKTFKIMHKYREHMKNKHEIQLSKVHGEMKNCPVCEFQNQSISRIRAHITIYHSATPGEFQCDQCDFFCRSKSGLRRHVKGMHKFQEGDHPEGNKQHIMDTGIGQYNQTLNNLQSSVLTHAPLVPRHDQDTGSPRSKTYDSQHSQNYVRPHSQTNVPPHSQTYVPTHPQTKVPPILSPMSQHFLKPIFHHTPRPMFRQILRHMSHQPMA